MSDAPHPTSYTILSLTDAVEDDCTMHATSSLQRDARTHKPTYDDKWNTMERSNAWFVNPIHEQYECGANELASALQDTAIANACQQELYEEVDNY